MAIYSTGTVSISGTTVTGTGTNWSTGVVKPDDILVVVMADGSNVLLPIHDLVSATEITLQTAYSGTAINGFGYFINPTNLKARLTDVVAAHEAAQQRYEGYAAHSERDDNPHGVTLEGIGGQPTDNPEFTGDLTTSGRLIGGIGAGTTGGVKDWNDATNARSGSGKTLLLGTATNGPGGGGYFHSFCHEYYTKGGTGNMTQLAIEYNASNRTPRQFARTRYQGNWGPWGEYAGGYEDGTWLPSLGGTGGATGQTYVRQLGRYVKVGKLVHIQASIQLSAKGSFNGSYVCLHGLPFVPHTATFSILNVSYMGALQSPVADPGIYINPGSVVPYFIGATGNSRTVSGFPQTAIGNGTFLMIGGSYIANTY